MRRLVLTIAAAVASLAVCTLSNGANAAPLGNPEGIRAAIDETSLTDKVRLHCTHWWNGHWHRRLRCWESYPLYYSYGPRLLIGPRLGFRSGFRGGFHGRYRRSDIELKHDIVLLGHLDNGLGFYRFAYNGSDKAYVGVMAQEVQTMMPEAVVRGNDGYLLVDYRRLGLTFQSYDLWVESGSKIPSGPAQR